MSRPTVSLQQHWSFPQPEEFKLPGGLRVWAFDLPGQHVASLELVMPAAVTQEPRDREGVATVALHASDEGTRAHPDGQIVELMERRGATLDGAVAQTWTRLGADAPAHRLSEVLPLFAEVVHQPDYAQADVAHHVELQVAAFESRLASPDAVAAQAFRTALFGDDHREGRPVAGTPETLGGITRDDVLAWHRQHWTPAEATLVVAGALAGSGLEQALEALGDWHADSPRPPHEPPAAKPAHTVLGELAEAVQTTLQVGCLTVGRSHPDWAALKLGAHVMAGAFASRLNLELRERRGHTYGVRGGVSARRHDGLLTMGGSFRADAAAEALDTIREFAALEEPFTDAEVADARRYLVGIAPLANETAADIARQAAALAAVGQPASFVNDHFAALEAASTESVTEAWRRHIRPDQLTVGASGPAGSLPVG